MKTWTLKKYRKDGEIFFNIDGISAPNVSNLEYICTVAVFLFEDSADSTFDLRGDCLGIVHQLEAIERGYTNA